MNKQKKGKPKSRGNGRGTVRQVGNRWRWEITLRYAADGRRMGLSGYADTKSAASAALEAALTDRRRNLLVDPDTVTVAEFAEDWQEKLHGVRPVTLRRYRQEISYALEHIGHLRLQAVTTEHIQSLSTELTNRPMRRGNVMSPRTRKHVLMHLRRLFDAAVNRNVIHRNPMSGLERQRYGLQLSAGDALNHRQARRFREVGQALYEAGMCRLWPAALVTVVTGLRRKEVMSLMQDDVDFERNRLFVRLNREYADGSFREADVKNRTSFRLVALPAWCSDLLREHLAAQRSEKQEAGDAWEDTGALFATRLGGWTHHDNLTRTVRKIVEWSDPATAESRGDSHSIWIGVPREKRQKLLEVVLSGEKLPAISPHDLRHTYATLALRDGQDIAVVSKRMGHSRVSTTLDIYRHVDEDELEDAYDIYAKTKG